MTPLGHLAVSVVLARWRGYARPAAALCLAGALLPDLIDKPLFYLGLAPVAHSVGHSVFVVGVAAGAVLAVPRARPAAPLVVGWLGHVAADLFVAYPKFLVNYGWPLLETRPTPDDPLVVYWTEYAVSGPGVVEGLCVLAAAFLLRDGGLVTGGDADPTGRGVE